MAKRRPVGRDGTGLRCSRRRSTRRDDRQGGLRGPAGSRHVRRARARLLAAVRDPARHASAVQPTRALDGRDFPDLPGPARSLPPLSLNLYGRLGESVAETGLRPAPHPLSDFRYRAAPPCRRRISLEPTGDPSTGAPLPFAFAQGWASGSTVHSDCVLTPVLTGHITTTVLVPLPSLTRCTASTMSGSRQVWDRMRPIVSASSRSQP